jgi:hypothetical protein
MMLAWSVAATCVPLDVDAKKTVLSVSVKLFFKKKTVK